MVKLSSKIPALEQGSLKLLKVRWWLSFGQLIHKGPGSDPRVAQLSMLSLLFVFTVFLFFSFLYKVKPDIRVPTFMTCIFAIDSMIVQPFCSLSNLKFFGNLKGFFGCRQKSIPMGDVRAI